MWCFIILTGVMSVYHLFIGNPIRGDIYFMGCAFAMCAADRIEVSWCRHIAICKELEELKDRIEWTRDDVRSLKGEDEDES